MNNATSARMLLVGDVSAINHPHGLGYLMEKVEGEFHSSDLVYANLEFPITDRGEFDMNKIWKVPLAMKPDAGKILAKSGIHVMSMATNHIMDFGPEGMLRSVGVLDENGIKHCGAGRNRDEAHQPVIFERNGVRIAFLAYTSVFSSTGTAGASTPGMATVQVKTAFMSDQRIFEQPGTPPVAIYMPNEDDMNEMRNDVRKARDAADVVVVAWHWGVSASRKHVSYQTELGRAAIDVGATLVIGHHSHVLHGVEVYKKGAIFYSLGDFVCWSGESPADTHEPSTVILDCKLERKGLTEITLIPVQIGHDAQPTVAKNAKGAQILQGLVKSSKPLGTSFRDVGGTLILDMPE